MIQNFISVVPVFSKSLLSPEAIKENLAHAVLLDFELSNNYNGIFIEDLEAIEQYYGKENAKAVEEYLFASIN